MFKKYSKVLIAATLTLVLAACGGGGSGGSTTTGGNITAGAAVDCTTTGGTITAGVPMVNATTGGGATFTDSLGHTCAFPFTYTYNDFYWLQNPGGSAISNTSTAVSTVTSIVNNLFVFFDRTFSYYSNRTGILGFNSTAPLQIKSTMMTAIDYSDPIEQVAVQICELIAPNPLRTSTNVLIDKNRATPITTALGLAGKSLFTQHKDCSPSTGININMAFAADGSMTVNNVDGTFTATQAQVNQMLNGGYIQWTIPGIATPYYVSMNAYSYLYGGAIQGGTIQLVVVLRYSQNLTGNTSNTAKSLEMWTL